MNKSQSVLKKFASLKSKFFDLRNGEEKIVKFLYAEQITTHFQGSEVDSIRYHLEVDGREMAWDRTHRELALQMACFSEGDLISIKRVGEKNKTKYFIEKIEK